MPLSGKVARVIGGTRGIGRGIVEVLAAESAHVVFLGRDSQAGTAVEASVTLSGGIAKYALRDEVGCRNDVKTDRGEPDRFAGTVEPGCCPGERRVSAVMAVGARERAADRAHRG